MEASPGSGRNAEAREPLRGDNERPANKNSPVSASGCRFMLEIYIRWHLWFSFDRMRSPTGGSGDRSVFRGAPGPLAQAGAPVCPPSGGPAPGSSREAPSSSLFPSSTWNQLRGPMILPPKHPAAASVLCVCQTHFLSAGLPARLHFIDAPG